MRILAAALEDPFKSCFKSSVLCVCSSIFVITIAKSKRIENNKSKSGLYLELAAASKCSGRVTCVIMFPVAP